MGRHATTPDGQRRTGRGIESQRRLRRTRRRGRVMPIGAVRRRIGTRARHRIASLRSMTGSRGGRLCLRIGVVVVRINDAPLFHDLASPGQGDAGDSCERRGEDLLTNIRGLTDPPGQRRTQAKEVRQPNPASGTCLNKNDHTGHLQKRDSPPRFSLILLLRLVLFPHNFDPTVPDEEEDQKAEGERAGGKRNGPGGVTAAEGGGAKDEPTAEAERRVESQIADGCQAHASPPFRVSS